MNKDKQFLIQALREHYASKSLTEMQQQKLYKLANKNVGTGFLNSKSGVFKWASSIAVSVFMAVFIMAYFKTPELITAAYVDIAKDSDLNNGMQPAMRQWLSENNINSSPQQNPIVMSKFCRLNDILATHFRIKASKQGEMNVFFHHGDQAIQWRNRSGTLDNINWKLITVRENLTVVVLYSQGIKEKSINSVLNVMLSELMV